MVLIILVLVYIFKIYALGTSLYIDDHNSYYNIAVSDSVIVSIVFLLYYTSSLLNKLLSRVVKVTIILLFIFYIVDLNIIYMFNSRLYIDDIFKFITNVDFKLFNKFVYIFIVLCLIACIAFVFKPNLKIKYISIKFLCFMSVFIVGCNYDVDSSIRSPFFKNYILVNFEATYENEYTDNFISSFDIVNNDQICKSTNKIKPKNIILFMFESWSYYHSDWFGKDNDWTPKLDHLAKNNISFNNFYANGFTTEAGLYATLTGKPIIPYKIKYGTDGALGLSSIHFETSYPEELSKLGYHPTFITAGDLGFLQKKQWLESLKFDRIIGNDSFDKVDRNFLFESVSDQKLYEMVYGIVSNSEKNFIVVENVNTHQPFYYPEGDEIKRSEEFSFRYADTQLSNVIKKLSTKDNMIIVMSDHRAMSTMTRKELQKSKRMSVSRVPMFMVWNGENKVINNVFQQTDVLPSITNAIEGQQCSSFSLGAIFPLNNMIDSKCVYHARGDERSKVSVMCDQQQFDVLLDGDDTRILDNNKSDIKSIDYINGIRINSNFRD